MLLVNPGWIWAQDFRLYITTIYVICYVQFLCLNNSSLLSYAACSCNLPQVLLYL